ncbi:MAG: 50S ribosomal protein L11 methyltransferase, partial [Solirubrobacterales bacterium]|nr:50S ribosomal protein L11 methyltransferase [Solirubrobacterales bacterium]
VIEDRLTVRPPWIAPGETDVDLVIDPGQAFGTGSHPTTRLCLELMLSLPPGGGFLDLGCGSGVLAIAAAALGWQPVLALDYDRVSVATTESNAAVNGVEVSARRADVRADSLPDHFETVAANLSSRLLIEVARRLPRVPARLIASGLLVDEIDPVVAACAERGLREQAHLTLNGWAAVLFANVERRGPSG